jgi:mannose-6-phosphate isomerase-like protein (cupin superfamily)
MSDMEKPQELEIISIPEHVARLREPFTMIDLASIDDLMLSIFLCQGTLPHHRHLDQDELFLVHSGTISLESEWGTAILRPGDLAVAPKGVGHRSSSLTRSMVLLLQPRLMVNRRNGDRRLFALKDQGRLEKVSVPAMGRQVAIPFKPVVLAHVDTYTLHLFSCKGDGPWREIERQDSLLFCFDGELMIETERHQSSLVGGELLIVPKGMAHRLSSTGQALVIGVERHRQPGLPLPD